MNKVKIFLSPIRAFKGKFMLLIGTSLVQGFVQFAYIFILKNIAHSIELRSVHMFRIRACILGANLVLNFALNTFSSGFGVVMARDVSTYLDGKHLKHFLQLDNNIVEKYGTGKIASIFQKGLVSWLTLIWKVFSTQVSLVFTFLISCIYLAFQGWQFLLVGIGLFVIATLWIMVFYNKGSVLRQKAKEVATEIDRLLVRWVMTKFEILQLGRYQEEANRDEKLNSEWAIYKYKERLRGSVCYDGASFFVQIIIASALVFIGYGAIYGHYNLSDYVLFSSLMALFGALVSQFTNEGKAISDNRIHIATLIDILYDPSLQHTSTFTGDTFMFASGDISFDTVSYNYGSGDVVDKLSLTIPGHKKTALVGPSGGGKTTLTKLISGYLQPTEGKIFVDGQDLSKINISSYYRHLGYLTQDPLVFDGTVRENLVYAYAGTPSEEQMHEALLRAKCEFVLELKEGLDTEIGERGIRLSGGQRQRLAIAKLFLKNPEIIILDEPTSALDSISEQAVTEAFENLFAGRTVIIIAHRLQTVKQADEILMIENGKIVERGTHQTLSTAGGMYQKMLELQVGF